MNAKKILAVLSFMLIAIFLTGCNQVPEVITPDDSLQKDLTGLEIPGVIHMIWAEKLAHDVYSTLEADYGTSFTNIAISEEKHMTELITMLTTHSLELDPTLNVATGVFPDYEVLLQTLYNDALAISTLEDALQLGIVIENLMIDYYSVVDVEHPGLEKLYANLLAGSKNHLAAFTLE